MPEEVFSGKKPKVSHLRILGCPVYIHILKQKRTNLDSSGKKGIFVRYSERSKDYIIYFLGFKNIDISIDVTFDEDSAYIKSSKRAVEESEEIEEPREPVDPPKDKNPLKRKLAWVHEII